MCISSSAQLMMVGGGGGGGLEEEGKILSCSEIDRATSEIGKQK